MSTGNNIKEARITAGLTQRELGERLGVTSATISAFEKDKTNIKRSTVARIAEALDLAYGFTKKGDAYFYNFRDTSALAAAIIHNSDNDIIEDSPNNYKMTNGEINILDNYNQLNNTGKLEAEKRIEELTHIKKYTTKD